MNPGYVKLEPPFSISGQGGVVAATEGAAVAEDGADQEGDGQAEGSGRRRERESRAAGIVKRIFLKFSFLKIKIVKL